MKKFGVVLCAPLCLGALALSSCGGESGSPPPVSVTPTPTPSPTPTPTPTPTYSTLQQLSGDQTFQTATVIYTDDATINGLTILSTAAEAFGQSTVINYIDASGEIELVAAGGSPTIRFVEANVTRQDAISRTWEINNGGVFDGIILFNPQGSYSFIGIWTHIENNLATYRLASAGIPTQDGDYPSGQVVYDIALGGATINGTTGNGVDATQSTGTLTMDFGTGQGTFSIDLKDSGGNALGTVTGTITRDGSGNGFSGTNNFQGVSGLISGAFFGPQGVEIALGNVASNSNGTVSYVGLGGGQAQ